MKNNLIRIFSVVAIVSISTSVYAQTELKEKISTESSKQSDSISSSAAVIEPEIKDLKEKIATKVAELRKKSQKPIAGTVAEISDKTIKISSEDLDEYEVKTDDSLTKYYQIGTTYKELKFADLKKGDYIIVTGPLLDKSVDANVIYRDESYTVVSGKITIVDKDNFLVKVTTISKDNYVFDIEKKTRQEILNIKTLEIDKATFSKIKEGDTIHIAAKKDPKIKEEGRFSAIRFLVIPQEYFQK